MASLPVACVVKSTNSLASKTAYFKCMSVDSEGGYIENYGYTFPTASIPVTAGNNTFVHAISLRPKLTYKGFENRILILLESIELVVKGNSSVEYRISTGATFSVAPTWADVDINNSGVQIGTGGTVSARGMSIDAGYVSSSSTSKGAISQNKSLRNPITLNRAGLQRAEGTISVFVRGITASSDCEIILEYKEIR
jgi:hypothetical protein